MAVTSTIGRRFLCFLLFWFSFFGSAQMFISENAQVYIGSNTEIYGEVKPIQSSGSKAGIYVSEGTYITNAGNLANAEIITQHKEIQEVATPKLAKRSALRNIVKEKKKIVSVKKDISSYPKIELPHSDSHFTIQESVSKTSVSQNQQYKISEREIPFTVFISAYYLPVNSYYRFQQSLSADSGTFSIRPPPVVMMVV